MKVAITGGIGSGKSFVSERLSAMGIQVYDCDEAAKRLVRTDEALRQQLISLIKGHHSQPSTLNSQLTKSSIARFLLASEENAKAINNLVHPAVARDFEQSGYNWLESAIYFDSGFDQRVYINKVVCVTAPLELRIQRVMRRDGITREKTLEWIHRQLPQEEIRRRSDYEIVNDEQHDIDQQLNKILKLINI